MEISKEEQQEMALEIVDNCNRFLDGNIDPGSCIASSLTLGFAMMGFSSEEIDTLFNVFTLMCKMKGYGHKEILGQLNLSMPEEDKQDDLTNEMQIQDILKTMK